MKKIITLGTIFFALTFLSCTSIFSGGTSGLIVDAESTSNPKQGIANVDVYAYTTEVERDSDFDSWCEGTWFVPAAEYYGHTTTDSDGSFLISKLVWETEKPYFGKDADKTEIYLLFFHENYGLTKGNTLIVSDSSSDTVYAELTAVRKSTNLTLNFVDIPSDGQTSIPMYVMVTVPQTTEVNPSAPAITYEQQITGTGTIRIVYPRWQSEANRAAGIETTPTITIKYFQSAEQIEWAGCYNQENEEKTFAFRSDASSGIKKVVKNKAYELTFYGKPTRIVMPTVSGQYICFGDAGDDGVEISMKRKDSEGNYTIDCGQVTTYAQAIGTGGAEKHGTFSNLGSGISWTDNSYTGKYAKAEVGIFVNGELKVEKTLRSDVGNYNVQIQ